MPGTRRRSIDGRTRRAPAADRSPVPVDPSAARAARSPRHELPTMCPDRVRRSIDGRHGQPTADAPRRFKFHVPITPRHRAKPPINPFPLLPLRAEGAQAARNPLPRTLDSPQPTADAPGTRQRPAVKTAPGAHNRHVSRRCTRKRQHLRVSGPAVGYARKNLPHRGGDGPSKSRRLAKSPYIFPSFFLFTKRERTQARARV